MRAGKTKQQWARIEVLLDGQEDIVLEDTEHKTDAEVVEENQDKDVIDPEKGELNFRILR